MHIPGISESAHINERGKVPPYKRSLPINKQQIIELKYEHLLHLMN